MKLAFDFGGHWSAVELKMKINTENETSTFEPTSTKTLRTIQRAAIDMLLLTQWCLCY
jgi:hypothetical protein